VPAVRAGYDLSVVKLDVQKERRPMHAYSGADLASVGEARKFVVRAIDREGWSDLGPTAALLTSELVANAVVHGDTGFVTRVSGTADGVRVEVDDGGGGEPVNLEVDATADRGRGLMIVAALSRRWGVDHHAAGKTVWFEL
jgi:anti-sigma regulatory factor (Ser/Thr protein kinase)